MARSQSEACSRESEGSISDSNGPECQPPGSASRMTTAGESSTGIGQGSLFTLTSPPSPPKTLSRSKFSAEDFRARISASQAKEPGSTGHGRVFGPSSLDSLGSFDPDTSSWRTFQRSLVEESGELLRTWPRSGMTRNGIVYRRQPLVPRTGATASGLWPTPAANPAGWQNIEIVDRDGNPPSHPNQRWYDKKTGRVVQKDLRHVIQRGMWPTPRASPNENRQTKPSPSQLAGKHGMSLGVAVNLPLTDEGLFTTPTAGDTGFHRTKYAQGGKPLSGQVGGKLNPMWVEWLMGFPLGWTDLSASETPLSRKSRNGSGSE